MFLALEKEFQMGLSSEILFLEREKFVYFTFTLFLISQRQKNRSQKRTITLPLAAENHCVVSCYQCE